MLCRPTWIHAHCPIFTCFDDNGDNCGEFLLCPCILGMQAAEKEFTLESTSLPCMPCQGKQRWPFTVVITSYRCLPSIAVVSQQTGDIEPLFDQCWASVVDGGPTLNQQWFNVSCLLGLCVLGGEELICHLTTNTMCWPNVRTEVTDRGQIEKQHLVSIVRDLHRINRS